MIAGFEPVDFARTLKPASLRDEAMSRVTLDFPLEPVTQILRGILRVLLRRRKRSLNK